jgi:uncharacterized membrane protein YjdF
LRPFNQSLVVYIIWLLLIGAAAIAIYEQQWATLFVAIVTFALTLAPLQFQRFYHVKIPVFFTSAIIVFTYFSLFLGEIRNFYELIWWWDILLHGGAAIGFGLIGFIMILMMFRDNKYAAPPIALAFFAFCFAMAIGVLWEVFEFGMDELFGLNMQKSGLADTMYDLIIDTFGAILGSAAGFFYLKGRWFGGLAGMIDEFVQSNHDLFDRKDDKS